jgi:hypothetical protein
LTNLTEKAFDGWAALGTNPASVLVMAPLTGETGLADIKASNGQKLIYLQLEPGESLILRTFNRKVDGDKWASFQKNGQSIEIKGPWHVTFTKGGPNLPRNVQIKELTSWTEFDGAEAKRFAGTAKYTVRFNRPAGQADDWLLHLGSVYESARVKINGQSIGTLCTFPFQRRIGRYLQDGENTLELEVTNLMANRIADMDRRGVGWRIFYEINFVNIQYNPFDASQWKPMPSGLVGPVRLVPLTFQKNE